MAVYFHSEETPFTLSQKSLYSDWVHQIIQEHSFQAGDLSFIFCSNAYLLEINKQYLNHNYFTDVITFNYNQEAILSGDIFISIDQVRLNAKALNLPFGMELSRVMIHGVLHLLGLNDKTEEETFLMRQAEDEALKKLEESGWNLSMM